ncbi:hypothetical protein BV25DRAFT_395776 [Artomyces pyxidatus]|uniref:Uncharacterized protein n=1 Tax=Artomyces pyxidatus TaxID=48021 RepID=A0ACB8T640_9AGAM|nr:hypothetical protein BV25DRAFT_395776 [Artomyces pyxidatus]
MERSSTMFTVHPHHYHHHLNIPTVPSGAGAAPAAAPAEGDPWAHMASTYAWLVEQELAAMAKKTDETRRWVLEQQIQFGLLGRSEERKENAPPSRKRPREAGHPWMARVGASETTRLKERDGRGKHEERSRLLQEEFERMEERWRERNERIQKRMRDERRWAEEQKESAERALRIERRRTAEAWAAYDRQWITLSRSAVPLTFRTIPWPMTGAPRNAWDITAEAISRFVLSPAHSEGISRKERIRRALLRWHPDRFGRLLGRVDERERAMVERGVGVVARCLNDMMAKEN